MIHGCGLQARPWEEYARVVPARKTPPTAETPVRELWNLSDLTAGWLEEIGIRTYADLEAADLVAVYRDLRARHKQVTRLMYYALWGALHNVHWNKIPEEEKSLAEVP